MTIQRTSLNYRTREIDNTTATIVGLLMIVSVAAFVTHLGWAAVQLLWNPNDANMGDIVVGIGGTVVPPLGIVHGFVLWLKGIVALFV